MLSAGMDASTALGDLESRIKTMLPEDYQDSYDDVRPVSMGSAALVFGSDGNVAWDEMWASFCDLAMAGGPPHKGTLLEPGAVAAIEAAPDRQRAVVAEICRGVWMVTRLVVQPSPVAGWVRVSCPSEGMAGWLLRAITMENVAVRMDERALDLPAGPHFRVEKEIKNVITVMAKTCHYWLGHMPSSQQRAIRELFLALAEKTPLVTPATSIDALGADDVHAEAARIGAAVHAHTGLAASSLRYAGWLGVECPTVRAAIWMMRTLVVSNVLARREGTTLFVAVNPTQDSGGVRVEQAVAEAHRLALARGIVAASSGRSL